MKSGRIIVITGAPGTGKTTASAFVAKESTMKKICAYAHGRFLSLP